MRRVLGSENLNTLLAIGNLGYLLEREGKLTEAEPYDREVLEKARRLLGEDNPGTLLAIGLMGGLLEKQGNHDAAEKLLAPAEPATRKAFTGDNAYRLASLLLHLGKARTGLGEFTAAEANLLEAQPIFVHARGPEHDRGMRECAQAIVDLYTAWNTKEPGKGYDAKAVEWKKKLDALGPASPTAAAR
jgi:tetratricopeptide (TPR) repeat protein